MSTSIQCPGCQKRYQVDEKLAGQRVKCKCGEAFTIPAPAPAEDELAPLDGGGDPDPFSLGDLQDPVDVPLAAESPATLPSRPRASGADEQRPGKTTTGKKEKKSGKKAREAARSKRLTMIVASICAVVAGAVLVVVLLYAASVNRAGGTSPEDAFAEHQSALREKDWVRQFEVLTPSSQQKILAGLVSLADRMEASEPNRSEEIRTFFAKHDRPADAPDNWWSDVSDKPQFYKELIKAIELAEENTWPINGAVRTSMRKAVGDARREQASAQLAELEVDGDTAKGQAVVRIDGDEYKQPVAFEKIDSRWFVHSTDLPRFHAVGGLGAF